MNRYFRIGVHMAMTQNVTAALGVIAGQLIGLQRHINGARLGFNALTTAISGMGMALAGTAMLRGVGSLLNSGKELIHQQALLRLAGESNQRVAQATEEAWKVAFSVRGTRVDDNLRTLGELRGLFENLGEAEQLLPGFAGFQRILQTVTGQSDERAGRTMAKMLDLVGAIRFTPGPNGTSNLDQDRFNMYMNAAQAAVIQNRGAVGPHELLNFVKMAGTAARVMSPETLFAEMSAPIESMGGFRAGTGIQALQRQFLRGIMTEDVFNQLRKLDLVEPGTPLQRPSLAARTQAAAEIGRGLNIPGRMVDTSKLRQLETRRIRGGRMLDEGRYYDYVMQVVVPKITRFLERSGEQVTEEAIMRELTKLGSTGPGQRVMAELYASRQQVERGRRAQRLVRGLGPERAMEVLTREDPNFAIQRLTASFHNLKVAIGSVGWEDLLNPMNNLADGIDKFTKVMKDNPNAARWLIRLSVALGIFLVVLGAVAIFAGAVAAVGGGGVALVIGLIVAGLTLLAYTLQDFDWAKLWADLQTGWSNLVARYREVIQNVVTGVSDAWQRFLATLRGWYTSFTEASERGRLSLIGFKDAVLAPLYSWYDSFMAASERGKTALNAFRDAIIQNTLEFMRGLPGQFMRGLRELPGVLFGGGAAAEPGAAASPSSFVPGPEQMRQRQEAAVYLDGQRVGRVIGPHLGREALGPSGSPNRPDVRRSAVHGVQFA